MKAWARIVHNGELRAAMEAQVCDLQYDADERQATDELPDVANMRVSVLAKTDETYTTFSTGPVAYRDPCRHQTGSLEAAVKAQRGDAETSEDLRKKFPLLAERHPHQQHIVHLCRKMKMPFAATTDRDVLEHMPPVLDNPDLYYDKFKDEAVAASELEMQRETVRVLGVQNLLEFYEVYCDCDTLQMADCFETYRDAVMEFTGLDPAHYVGSPGLAKDAALFKSKARIGLIHAENGGYDFIDDLNKNTMGGLSCVFTRFATANNPLCEQEGLPFDRSKPTAHIVPLDANSLYPYAMTKCLPVGDFRLDENVTVEDIHAWIRTYHEDDTEGGAVCCDIWVPPELHDTFALAPVAKRAPLAEEVSELQRECATLFDSHGGVKLVPYLGKQREVLLHIAKLQCYVRLGVRFDNVRYVRRWTQRPFLKEFIQTCMKARNSYSKGHPMNQAVKIIMNSLYGKFLENKEEHCNTSIFTNPDKFVKAVSKSTTRSFHMFDLDENFLAVVNRHKGHGVVLDTARAVGWAVLELSKVHMYDQLYNGVLKMWRPSQVQLLLMDTDSYYLRVETEDLIGDFAKANRGDFGSFRVDTGHVNPKCPYKGELGRLKLEDGAMIAYAGVTEKVYATLSIDPEKGAQEEKKFKGMPKAARKQIRFQNYRDIVHDMRAGLDENGRPLSISYHTMRSREHSLEHRCETKKSLAPTSWKTHWIEDFRSRPLGHWREHMNLSPVQTALMLCASALVHLQARWGQTV